MPIRALIICEEAFQSSASSIILSTVVSHAEAHDGVVNCAIKACTIMTRTDI